MIVMCTICSREKRHNTGLLPARIRYKGVHVKRVAEVARRFDIPFFVLSGALGLISGEELISDYDHRLVDCEIFALAIHVVEQIRSADISKIVFFQKDNSGWKPYCTTIRLATSAANIPLQMEELPPWM